MAAKPPFHLQSEDKSQPYNLFAIVEDLHKVRELVNSPSINEKAIQTPNIRVEQDRITHRIDALSGKINKAIDAYLITKELNGYQIEKMTNDKSSPFYDPTAPKGRDQNRAFFEKHVVGALKEAQASLCVLKDPTAKSPMAKTGLAKDIGQLYASLYDKGAKKQLTEVDSLLQTYGAFTKPDSRATKCLKEAHEKANNNLKLGLRGAERINLDQGITILRRSHDPRNGVIPDEFSPIHQSMDVLTGDSGGDCYGYIREQSERTMQKQGVEGLFSDDEAIHDIDSQSPEAVIQRGRAHYRTVYHRQITQTSAQRSDFNASHDKRLTRRHFIGSEEKQDQGFLVQELFKQADTHKNMPMELDLQGKGGGHAVGFMLTVNSKQERGPAAIHFTDPNRGTYIFNGKDEAEVKDNFSKWFTGPKGYCSELLKSFDMFEIHCYKPKEKSAAEHKSISGKLRSVLTGSRYSNSAGLLGPVHAIKRWRDSMGKEKDKSASGDGLQSCDEQDKRDQCNFTDHDGVLSDEERERMDKLLESGGVKKENNKASKDVIEKEIKEMASDKHSSTKEQKDEQEERESKAP